MSPPAKKEEDEKPGVRMSLESIMDGENPRGIPATKFLDDIDAFAAEFSPPATAELLIGSYADLLAKYKQTEVALTQRRSKFQEKIPEIEKSLSLVRSLKRKHDDEETVVARYSLADAVYGKAEVDMSSGIVNLWLGANVMLEYTYSEAIELLVSKEEAAKRAFSDATEDLAFTRNQIVTSEVCISRIYNWDVRRKRERMMKDGK